MSSARKYVVNQTVSTIASTKAVRVITPIRGNKSLNFISPPGKGDGAKGEQRACHAVTNYFCSPRPEWELGRNVSARVKMSCSWANLPAINVTNLSGRSMRRDLKGEGAFLNRGGRQSVQALSAHMSRSASRHRGWLSEARRALVGSEMAFQIDHRGRE